MDEHKNRGGDGTFRVSRYTHKPEGGEHTLPTQCKLGPPWQVPIVLSHGVPRKLAARRPGLSPASAPRGQL